MYRLELNYVSRNSGSKGKKRDATTQGHGFSAAAAIAYRSGSIVTDARTGEVHDYTRKRGIGYCEIVLPSGAPSWANHREALWNAVEAAESRKDARLMHEFIIALPHGLTEEQEIAMVRDLAQSISDRHRLAVDFAIHRDNPRTWDGSVKGVVGKHAHIAMTTRELTPEGFSKVKRREFTDRKLGPKTLDHWREQWAVIGNRHMALAGLDERWDHRTLSAQLDDAEWWGNTAAADALDRQPGVHIGAASTAMERKGIDTYWGNQNRIILARNTERRLERERKRVADSLAVAQRRLRELHAEQEAEAAQVESSHDDPRWVVFEDEFMRAAQFEHGLSLSDLIPALAGLKPRFAAEMKKADARGITPEMYARVQAKEMAEWDRQNMRELAARDADPESPPEDNHDAAPTP